MKISDDDRAPAVNDDSRIVGALQEAAAGNVTTRVVCVSPLPPLAPIELTGESLAEWLYDNTQWSFAEIAAVSGIAEARVEAIADGAPPTPEKSSLEAVTPAPVDWAAEPANARPAPDFAAQHSVQAEIPGRVLRWARWFLTARWRLADVAHLFDVSPADLAAALDRRKRAA